METCVIEVRFPLWATTAKRQAGAPTAALTVKRGGALGNRFGNVARAQGRFAEMRYSGPVSLRVPVRGADVQPSCLVRPVD